MFDQNRPKLKLNKTNTQRYLEYATFGLLILATLYTIVSYSSLPEQVPIHFNLSGKVDNYGDKSFVWFPLILGFALCYGLLKLNKHPHLFNYPSEITKDNAEKNYTSAVKILTLLNFMIGLVFAIITYQVVSLAINETEKTSTWSEYLLYIIIGLMTFGPLIWVVVNVFSSKKK